jgi:hypothetical protein
MENPNMPTPISVQNKSRFKVIDVRFERVFAPTTAAIIACGLFMPHAPADCPSTFAPAAHYGVGIEPYAVAIADFNRDGRPDVATANYSSHTISLRLGLANGTLSPATTTISTGANPSSIASADFNGDGKPDLVTACLGSSSVCVRLNTSNGGPPTFAGSVQYIIPGLPYHVAIGDLNGDNRPDLVTANGFSNSISVLKGNANGSFSPPIDFTVGQSGAQPECVALGDADGDGILDAMTANYAAGTVSCLRGRGDGSFDAPVESTGIDSLARSLCAADFNHDGLADLAVATADVPGPVTILLSMGEGTFAPPVDYAAGVSSGIAAGDLNGDGRVDIALAKNYFGGPGTAAILLGHGDGTFAQAVDYPVESGPSGIAIADMNADSHLDLAVTNDFSGSVSILLSQGYSQAAIDPQPIDQAVAFGGQAQFTVGATGQGPFEYQWRHYGTPIADGGHYNGATAATLTVSGATTLEAGSYDVLIFSGCRTELKLASELAQLTLLPNPGPGGCESTFASADYAAPSDPRGIATGDLNGDGRLDMLTTNEEGASVTAFLGNDSGGFQAGLTSQVQGGPWAAVIGEFTRDAVADVAISLPANASIAVLPGNGDGTFGSASIYPTDLGAMGLATTDLNNDGYADLVIANYDSNNITVLLGNSNGGLDQPAGGYAVGAHPKGVALDDLNGDSAIDIVVSNESSNTISVLTGAGDGTFVSAESFAAGAAPTSVAIGDLNADGRLDLAVANPADGKVSILSGNGNGSFTAPLSFLAGSAPISVRIGDFNGDGRPDVATANHTGNDVSVLAGLPFGTFANPISLPVAAGPYALSLDDLDNDGRLDIVVASEVANRVTVLSNVGQGIGFNPQPENLWVVGGDAATFSVIAIGAGPFRYQWRRNGVPIVGATSSTLTIHSASAADSGAYDVQVRGGCNPAVVAISHPAALHVDPYGACLADIHRDGLVDLWDLALLLSQFGTTCP